MIGTQIHCPDLLEKLVFSILKQNPASVKKGNFKFEVRCLQLHNIY